MSQEPEHDAPSDAEAAPGHPAQQQQQEQPHAEAHAGQGSESILKELREWESRRAANSGGKRRSGPS